MMTMLLSVVMVSNYALGEDRNQQQEEDIYKDVTLDAGQVAIIADNTDEVYLPYDSQEQILERHQGVVLSLLVYKNPAPLLNEFSTCIPSYSNSIEAPFIYISKFKQSKRCPGVEKLSNSINSYPLSI